MNWLAIIAAFAISLIVGAFLGRVVSRSRPSWSARRQLWAAALPLPGLIILASICGLAFISFDGQGTGENMQDLALAATAAIGLLFAMLSLFGGLIGVGLALPRKRP